MAHVLIYIMYNMKDGVTVMVYDYMYSEYVQFIIFTVRLPLL